MVCCPLTILGHLFICYHNYECIIEQGRRVDWVCPVTVVWRRGNSARQISTICIYIPFQMKYVSHIKNCNDVVVVCLLFGRLHVFLSKYYCARFIFIGKTSYSYWIHNCKQNLSQRGQKKNWCIFLLYSNRITYCMQVDSITALGKNIKPRLLNGPIYSNSYAKSCT